LVHGSCPPGFFVVIIEKKNHFRNKKDNEIVSKVISDKCISGLDKLYKNQMLLLYEPQNFVFRKRFQLKFEIACDIFIPLDSWNRFQRQICRMIRTIFRRKLE